MYAPSIAILKSEYKEVEATDLIKNNLSREGLSNIEGMKFVAKKTVVKMAKIADMGIEPNTVIESPWGDTQTALEGAYIVNGGSEAYVVNKESSGILPIGNIPA